MRLEVDGLVAGEQADAEPLLHLPAPRPRRSTGLRQLVGQPVLGLGQHLDVGAGQTRLLFELTQRPHARLFAVVEPALGELPATGAGGSALETEDQPLSVDHDDSDPGAKELCCHGSRDGPTDGHHG